VAKSNFDVTARTFINFVFFANTAASLDTRISGMYSIITERIVDNEELADQGIEKDCLIVVGVRSSKLVIR
jgi:hypothetical protein